jgi:hypothetical protein
MGKNLIFPWLFQKIRLNLSYQNRKTMNSNSVRIGSSVYPNGMTSEQWNAHSFGIDINEVPTYAIGQRSVYPNNMTGEQWNAQGGIELTGYADINPNTSVYPNNMTSEQWSEQANDNANVNRCFNRVGYLLSRMQRTAN